MLHKQFYQNRTLVMTALSQSRKHKIFWHENKIEIQRSYKFGETKIFGLDLKHFLIVHGQSKSHILCSLSVLHGYMTVGAPCNVQIEKVGSNMLMPFPVLIEHTDPHLLVQFRHSIYICTNCA